MPGDHNIGVTSDTSSVMAANVRKDLEEVFLEFSGREWKVQAVGQRA